MNVQDVCEGWLAGRGGGGLHLSGTTPKISERSTEGDQVMGRLTAHFIGLREFRRGLSRGQTMTEYTLILAAIAVACFTVYAVTGQDINALVTWNAIDKDLTNALGRERLGPASDGVGRHLDESRAPRRGRSK